MTALKGWSADPSLVPPYYLIPADVAPPSMPSGRLAVTPPFFTVTVEWDDLKPPEEQLTFFEDVLLKRELLQEFDPPAVLQDWLEFIRPSLTYTCCHWVDQGALGLIGGSVKWYLFYGQMTDVGAVQFEDPPIDQTQLSTVLFDVDSVGTPSTSEGDPAVGQGWLLCLVNKLFTLDPDPTKPPILSFHVYAAYALTPSDEYVASPGTCPPPIFDPLVPTEWSIFQNLLNFPLHTITLAPFQP